MILSVSRRTDIPCHYPEWFFHRLREGFVLVRNPMNYSQLGKINLSPDVVDCIVSWTKDAKNLLPYLPKIGEMGYAYCFQFTLTPYDHTIEKNLRAKDQIEDTFIELSKQIGKERVFWRYDPVILNESLTLAYHKENFIRLCRKLSPYTNVVTISFVDCYSKLKTPLVREITKEEMQELSLFFAKTAKEYGLMIQACCEGDLSAYGIKKASCIDRELIEKVCGFSLNLAKDKNQRKGCGCCESIDIGAYNTCINGCIYCYANRSLGAAVKNHRFHNPENPLLLGVVREEDYVQERVIKSNRQEQVKWF